MTESALRLYSLGIVIEAKQRGSDQIKCSPMERLPLQSGDMTQNTRVYQTSIPDAAGIKRSSAVTGSNHVVAKWMPSGQDNRMTAPDVQPGETVSIYRFADTDEYYWTTTFREPSLRKLETILTAACGLPGAGSFDKDSAYWTEVSTHDGHIQIHTSQANGEPYGYDILIDTATGRLTITDSIQNTIILDSVTSTAAVTTNTAIILKSPTVTIESDTIQLTASHVNIKGDLSIDGSVSGTKGASFVQDVTAPNI